MRAEAHLATKEALPTSPPCLPEIWARIPRDASSAAAGRRARVARSRKGGGVTAGNTAYSTSQGESRGNEAPVREPSSSAQRQRWSLSRTGPIRLKRREPLAVSRPADQRGTYGPQPDGSRSLLPTPRNNLPWRVRRVPPIRHPPVLKLLPSSHRVDCRRRGPDSRADEACLARYLNTTTAGRGDERRPRALAAHSGNEEEGGLPGAYLGTSFLSPQ